MSDHADDAARSDDETGAEIGESSPVRRVLDLLVFAPVGVALTVVEDLPGLVNKGRHRFETDIRNARVLGEFVLNKGQRHLSERVDHLLHGETSASPEEASTATSARAPATSAGTISAPVPSKPDPDPADEIIVDGALAGYDTLSASQVVRRLESLGADELRAVHRHESSHRHRRTILNRAHQLLEGGAIDDPPVPPEARTVPEPERPVE